MACTIRELLETDFTNYLEVINDFRKTNFAEEEFIRIVRSFKPHSMIFVIEKDSKIIATGTLIIEQKFIYNCAKLAHIEDVCVKKEFRNRGYGKSIVRKLIDEARKQNCYKVTLVCAESNTDFYKKNNFEMRGLQMSQLLQHH